jgi:hypothetical protein
VDRRGTGAAVTACLLAALVLLLCGVSRAEPGWELGPKLELGSRTLPLRDGRLLTCFEAPSGSRCDFVDPLTSERRPAVVPDPKLLDGALSLADGQLLFPFAELLLDPESGTTRRLAPSGRRLGQMVPMPLAAGRVAFRRMDFAPPWEPARLLLYLGAERGFRELEVGPAGTSVQAVFDLEDGRLLIARAVPRSRGGQDLEFLLFGLEDGKWARGARIPMSTPLVAFRSDDRIVVVLAGGTMRALFLDAAGGLPRFERVGDPNPTARAHRLGREQVLFWDSHGGISWDARRKIVAKALFPFGPPHAGLALERGGRLSLVDASTGRTVLWSYDRAPPETPCSDVFDYIEAALAAKGGWVDSAKLQGLLDAPRSSGCVEFLERQRRLPEFLRAPLEQLAAAGKGPASDQQEAAATALCVLSPTFSASLVARLNRPGVLRPGLNDLCRESSERIPVLAAARAQRNVAATLAGAALMRTDDDGGAWVRHWVVPLLAARPDIARESARLLLLAHEKRAGGFDSLRKTVCSKAPGGELARACERTAGANERDFRRKGELSAALARLGVATAVAGGLGTLAYVGRNGDLGRGIAIGSGIAGGGALVGLITLKASSGGDSRGMGGLLLAVPLAALGAVGGGIAAAKLSEKPGTQRFATAAVPLSAALLTGVVLTLEDL